VSVSSGSRGGRLGEGRGCGGVDEAAGLGLGEGEGEAVLGEFGLDGAQLVQGAEARSLSPRAWASVGLGGEVGGPVGAGALEDRALLEALALGLDVLRAQLAGGEEGEPLRLEVGEGRAVGGREVAGAAVEVR
jgi:hypothetical protein